jgi:hypothetical protein
VQHKSTFGECHGCLIVQDDKIAAAKLKAASALYFLKTKKYKLAAMKFTEVHCWFVESRSRCSQSCELMLQLPTVAWAATLSCVKLHGDQQVLPG